MSVYRDTDTATHFEHPHPGPLKAEVYRNGVKLREVVDISPVVVPGAANKYTLPLTYKETEFDGQLDIRWSADGFVRTTAEKVITPLVSLSKLQTVFKDLNWAPAELAQLENSVRIAIESYTRQSFGYFVGTETIVGSGDKKVALPKRLIAATSISGGPVGYFSIGNDGWNLYIRNKNLLTTKEAPPEDYMDNHLYMTQGVIVVPDTYWKQFRVGARYSITGEWGYYSVPEDIQEAALLLANDIACGDSIYRDRYVELMKAADWNFSFNEGAWRGTGNVRVDQLLQPYRRDGMIII